MTDLNTKTIDAGAVEPVTSPSLNLPNSERPLLDARAEISAYTYATADSAEVREASLAAIADTFRQDGHPDPRAAAEAELQRRGSIADDPSKPSETE